MFAMYRGWGARLLRALVQLSLDRNADAYEEVRPPTLVLTETMVATGHLPKFADEAYHVERDDLWAIPTAEVPLTSLHRDEILDAADLPAAVHRLHVVLPPRGRIGREGHPGPAASPRVRQGRAAGGGRGRRAGHRLPGGRARPQRGTAARPRAGLPHRRPVHRRPRQLGGPHVGHRGLRPGRRPVARGVVGVVVLRLPGPPGQHPLPARGRSRRRRRRQRRQGRRARSSPTRSTARRWAGPARSPPTSRPTAEPDGSVAIVDALRPYLGGAEAITPAARARRRRPLGGRGQAQDAQRPDRAKCCGDSSKPWADRSRSARSSSASSGTSTTAPHDEHTAWWCGPTVAVIEVEGRRAVPQVDVADHAKLLEPVERAVHGGPVGLGVAPAFALGHPGHDLVGRDVVIAGDQRLDDGPPRRRRRGRPAPAAATGSRQPNGDCRSPEGR